MKLAVIFLLALAAGALLGGCSSFRLGGVAYCPHGQNCDFSVRVPGPSTLQ